MSASAGGAVERTEAVGRDSAAEGRPIVIAGLARSGTSWAGRMLESTGSCVYINEPFNPQHPPGRSPGIMRGPVTHLYEYVTSDVEEPWVDALSDTFALRFHVLDEFRVNHTIYDFGRIAKYWTTFNLGRVRNRRPLVKDPYMTLSVDWLARRMGAVCAVVVRHPAAVYASYRRLGWQAHLDQLLNQPLLLRDWLGPMTEDLERAHRTGDHLEQVAVLWRAVNAVALGASDRNPDVHLVRYEDLAADPLGALPHLCATLGVPWSARARQFATATTTGPSGGRRGAFSWQIGGGGLSRSAFKPMNSHSQVDAWRSKVGPEELGRLHALTGGPAAELYPDWSGD